MKKVQMLKFEYLTEIRQNEYEKCSKKLKI